MYSSYSNFSTMNKSQNKAIFSFQYLKLRFYKWLTFLLIFNWPFLPISERIIFINKVAHRMIVEVTFFSKRKTL